MNIIDEYNNNGMNGVYSILGKGIDTHDNKGRSYLMIATVIKMYDLVIAMLDHGMDVNIQNTSDSFVTALMAVSYNGNASMASLLLKYGADPDIQDMNGKTALIIACRRGHDRIAKMLIMNGANPNIGMEDGVTPLMFASRRSYYNIVELLLANGANPFAESNDRNTAYKLSKLNSIKTMIGILPNSMYKNRDRSRDYMVAYDDIDILF